MTRTFSALGCVVVLACLNGCAGDGPPAETGGAAFDVIQRDIFNVHCLSAGCHNVQSQAGNLILSEGLSFSNLVDVPPENISARDEGLLRVAPFEPDLSFLLVKVTGPPPPGQGSQMPQGMTPLAPDQIELIRQWIVDGALPPPTPPAGSVTPTAPATISPTETASTTPTEVPLTPSPSAPVAATATSTGLGAASATPTASPTPSASTGVTVTLEQVQSEIFNPNCLSAGCHDATSHSGNLVLEPGRSFDALVNVEPDNASARAEGLLRVTPGDPAGSFLVIKLEGPPLIQGGRMPFLLPPLPPAQIELVRQWIEQGANP